MASPGYYDLPGSRMLPGGQLAASPDYQGGSRSFSGVDVPLPGSGGPLTGDYRYSIPGAGLPNPTFGGGDPYFNYNPNTIQNQYIMGGFAPLELGKLIYGGFNPNGTSRDPAIVLGRSIAHGLRGGGEPDVQTNSDFRPVYGNTANGLPPASAAAQAYANIARQPGIPDDLAPRTPNGGMLPGGMPRREFGGTGFGAYATAQNNFIPGLVAWNGPGQANPTGGEPIDERGSRNFMGLARRLGGMGIQGGNTPINAPAPNWAAHNFKVRG